jgi:hypothetical protein
MLSKTRKILKSKGFKLYERPYQLNIVAYRSRHLRSNAFDDEIHVFYTNDEGKWIYHIFKGTTDPGQFWLNNPMNPQGTAFLKKGQYENAYAIGYHRGVYEALVQVKEVTVIRNYDRRGLFNLLETGLEDTGIFGINIHRASQTGTTKSIDRYSAGCIVFSNIEDYRQFIQLAKIHRQRHGNVFTLTLVDFRDERKQKLKKIAVGTLMASSMLLFANVYYNQKAYETI